jgi:hypothetical protein
MSFYIDVDRKGMLHGGWIEANTSFSGANGKRG